MRRALAILLTCVLGLPLLASAIGQSQQSHLPACCRRGGMHHCMEMALAQDTSSQPTVRTTCPAYPHRIATVQHGAWTSPNARLNVIRLAFEPHQVGQVEAGYRIALGRAWQKRGPPQSNS